ncbi:rubrerythrin family protein [Streptomyces sp. NPDC049906]|uniref:rubrerythrin family protein n=1 Tax=Streptomyces sp. NPDC049906 TaxID=3155656 RepID=UPI00343B67FE
MPQLGEGLTGDLRSAFAAEAASVQRYTYFAQVAEIEGHGEIARLFTDLAESVACVAHGHIDALRDVADPHTRGSVGGTRLNLASSAAEALHEANEVYPGLTAHAHEEGHADVASWLTTLASLKRAHLAKLDALLTALDQPLVPPSPGALATDGGADD